MEPIIRAAIMYGFLLIVMRISGARTLGEVNLFDFVLLLIIGDCTQQAITSNDYSVTNAVLIIITLVTLDITLNFLKFKFKKLDRILDGKPQILVIHGKPQKKIMAQLRIDVDDILERGRKLRGLENMEQIKYAILEKDGEITIIPV